MSLRKQYEEMKKVLYAMVRGMSRRRVGMRVTISVGMRVAISVSMNVTISVRMSVRFEGLRFAQWTKWWESNPRLRHGLPGCHHNTSLGK